MIPSILITCFFGTFILAVFGKTYATSGTGFLQLLAIAGIFVSVNNIGSAVVHIRKKIYFYTTFNAVAAAITTVAMFIFLPMKLPGVGYAFMAGQGASAVLYVFVLLKKD